MANVAAGAKVHYSGTVWTVTGIEADPVNVGAFVDLARVDDPAITARIHSAQLAPDTTGGWTWQMERPPAGSRHSGDPRFPLSPEFTDRHQKFNQLIERVAEDLFNRSRWADDGSWETLTEAKRDRLRQIVRGVILNLPLGARPQGVTALQVRTRVTALLPQELKDWLVANPQ